MDDLTDDQLSSLRAQKGDDQFPLGVCPNRNDPKYELQIRSTVMKAVNDRMQPPRGIKIRDLVDEYGTTLLDLQPINGNNFHRFFLDPELKSKNDKKIEQMKIEYEKRGL